MTAEIAILNCSAVALAADSAVTIGNKKVFNSVNKLFSLSKRHPVGIMIYGNAEVMGVPWETAIKLYREQLGTQNFDSLADYADDFLKFLTNDPRLFPREAQNHVVGVRAYIECYALRERIVGRAGDSIQKGQQLSEDDTRKIAEEVALEYLKGLETSPFLPGQDEYFLNYLESEFSEEMNGAFQNVFGNLPQPEKFKKTLFRIISTFFAREIFAGQSGVVVAGFGRHDIYPRLRSFLIGDYVRGTLKWKLQQNENITSINRSGFIPFAQSEMVHTFALGIDPEFDTVMRKAMAAAQSEFTDSLIKLITPKLSGLPSDEITKLSEDIRNEQSKLMISLRKELRTYQEKAYIDPLHETVASLPGPELAAMAESLVNLTSFKRRMSMEKETVGGPIDVALITKGDGLVWIKRKHYFEAPLNPQFFANYNRGEDGYKKDRQD